MKKIIFFIGLIVGGISFSAWADDCVCCGGEPLESGGICVKYLGSDTCQYREAGVDIEPDKDPGYELCPTTPGTTNNGQCTCPSISGGGCSYNACCGNLGRYNTNERTCYTNFGSGITDLGHYYLSSDSNLAGTVISSELGYYVEVPNGTGGFNSSTCSCTTSGGCGSSETLIGDACCGNEEISACQNSGGAMTSTGTVCSCSCPTGKIADDSSNCICENSAQQAYCENANPATGYVTGSWNEDTCNCSCPGNSNFSNLAGCYCSAPYVVQNGTCIACGTNEVSCGTNGCVDMGNCSGSRDGLNGNYNTYGGVASSDCSGYQLCSVARECSPVTATNVYYGECFCSEAYLKTKCTASQTYDTGACTCINCSGTVINNHCCTNTPPTNAHVTYDNNTCGWACDSNYTPINNSACCLTSAYTTCTNSGGTLDSNCSCTCSGTLPAHASYVSGSCDWTCNSGYVKNQEGTACICSNDEQKTYCETVSPAPGYITGTWDENMCSCSCPGTSTFSESGCACSGTLPTHASYTTGSCDWACNSGYVKNQEGIACICPEGYEEVNAHCCSTASMPTNAHVTCDGTSLSCMCGWTCDNNYTSVNNSICCLTSAYTTCINSGGTLDSNCSCTCSGALPAHATYVTGSCDWTCEGDYVKNTAGTACVCSNDEQKTYCEAVSPASGYVTGSWNENTCSCSCPENSTSSELGCACSGTLPAHASYVSGSCDWECDSDYKEEGGSCVCDKTCTTGILNTNTCSCECTEISCGAPHQKISYENETCGCTCEEGYDEVESNSCCPTADIQACSNAGKVLSYNNGACSCDCPEGQTEVGGHCCPGCSGNHQSPTYENETCGCACDSGYTEVESICCPNCSGGKEITVSGGACSCECPESQTEVSEHCCPTCTGNNISAAYENETCGCSCEDGYEEAETGICCPLCPSTDQHVSYTGNQCTCVCTDTNKIPIGNVCCDPCDSPKEAATDGNNSCTCSCPEEQTEVGAGCCPTTEVQDCSSAGKVSSYDNGICSCSCPEGQTEVGNTCCNACDDPKEAITDESGSCSCDCPVGTDGTHRLLYDDPSKTCVECLENEEGDYQHYRFGGVPCCASGTGDSFSPSAVEPPSASFVASPSPVTTPVLNSLSAILKKFSSLSETTSSASAKGPSIPATTTSQSPVPAPQSPVIYEEETKGEEQQPSPQEETTVQQSAYDKNGSIWLKLKDARVVATGNAPSFCSGTLEIQNDIGGVITALTLNLTYGETTVPLNFSAVANKQSIPKKLALAGSACNAFTSVPKITIVKCTIKGAESDSSACRGRIKFLVTN